MKKPKKKIDRKDVIYTFDADGYAKIASELKPQLAAKDKRIAELEGALKELRLAGLQLLANLPTGEYSGLGDMRFNLRQAEAALSTPPDSTRGLYRPFGKAEEWGPVNPDCPRCHGKGREETPKCGCVADPESWAKAQVSAGQQQTPEQTFAEPAKCKMCGGTGSVTSGGRIVGCPCGDATPPQTEAAPVSDWERRYGQLAEAHADLRAQLAAANERIDMGEQLAAEQALRLCQELKAANARTEEYKREVERRDEYLRGADADVNAYRERAEKLQAILDAENHADAKKLSEAEHGAAVLREALEAIKVGPLGNTQWSHEDFTRVAIRIAADALSSNAGKQRSEEFAALEVELGGLKSYRNKLESVGDQLVRERDALKAELAEAVWLLSLGHAFPGRCASHEAVLKFLAHVTPGGGEG